MNKKNVTIGLAAVAAALVFSGFLHAQWATTDDYTSTENKVGIGTTMEPDFGQLYIFKDGAPVDLRMSSNHPGESPPAIGRLQLHHSTTGDFYSIALLQRGGDREMTQAAYRASDNQYITFNYLNFSTGKYEMRRGVTGVEFLNSGPILFNNRAGGELLPVGVHVSEADAAAKLAGVALGVNGTLRATEMIVEAYNDWPDYVFSDSYPLMSLPDIEKYIRVNGHLPEVPTAEKVVSDGVNVGQITSVLLKKVEELTLHVIELNKRIAELES